MLSIFKNKPKTPEELEKQQQLKEKKQKEIEERKQIAKLVNDWVEIMAHLELDNQIDQTFRLENIKKEPYGFSANIGIEKGLNFSMLESEPNVKTIEDNLGCIFVTKRVLKSKHMKAQFIMEDIPEIDFEPYSTEDNKTAQPYELYLGTSIDGNSILVSMLKYPHLIVQGATNMGKTKMIDCVLTNAIVQNSPSDLSIYILQADKSDQIIYRKCKHCRCFADDLYKILAITNYLCEIVNQRDKILRQLIEDGICDNIFSYNKVHKKYKQPHFTYIYIVIDEYSSLMPGDADEKEIKKMKNTIQNNMERIIQVGRYVGLYTIIGLQRSTVDKLPSFIKAMCNTIATFRVNNERSSYVAIDSNEAVNLNPRESIIKTNEKMMAKTVTITPEIILNYIKPFRWSNSEYHDFQYENWINVKKESQQSIIRVSKNQRRKRERYSSEINPETSKTRLEDDSPTQISKSSKTKI